MYFGKVTLGSDPELFLKNKDGKIVSAIGKIGGTKKKPRPIKELGKGFFVQEDNVLLEYNTPIAKQEDQWVGNHLAIREYLKNMVGQQGLELADIASHSMPADEMKTPKAWVFGCDPDFNVWDLKMNPKPYASDPLLRSAGGHIHVGLDDPTPPEMIRLGRLLDLFVGAPLAMKDQDKTRRELYGKAGSIRFKPYGLEYRTPSNYWTLSEHNIRGVFYNVWQAISWLTNYNHVPTEVLQHSKKFINGEDEKFDFLYAKMQFNLKEFV